MSYQFPPQSGYRARAIRVVDGDTIDLLVDMGFHDMRRERFRLLGVNAPETHASDPVERARAVAATAFVTEWLEKANAFDLADWGVRVDTKKDPDSFGRYLVKVWRIADPGEEELGAALLAAGLATVYP